MSFMGMSMSTVCIFWTYGGILSITMENCKGKYGFFVAYALQYPIMKHLAKTLAPERKGSRVGCPVKFSGG